MASVRKGTIVTLISVQSWLLKKKNALPTNNVPLATNVLVAYVVNSIHLKMEFRLMMVIYVSLWSQLMVFAEK